MMNTDFPTSWDANKKAATDPMAFALTLLCENAAEDKDLSNFIQTFLDKTAEVVGNEFADEMAQVIEGAIRTHRNNREE